MDEFLEKTLFHFGHYDLKVYTVFGIIILIIAILIVQLSLRKLIYRSRKLDKAKKFAFSKLSKYVLAVFATIIGMRILGFDLTVLAASSAALLVGIGFGLQGLFSDFISGIILLLDATLKVDDVIEVNGSKYLVKEINFRTTTVIGRDENYVIMPNTLLTSNEVVNWTYNKISSRFKVTVAVDYSSDVPKLMKALEDVVKNHPLVLTEPIPFVRFEEYGDSSINFAVYYHSNEIFRSDAVKSDIRVEIFKKLKENGISIPFPQRVVHLKQ